MLKTQIVVKAASRVLVNDELPAGRTGPAPVSYTHLRAHETVLDLVCRLLLEKKKKYTSIMLSIHLPHYISTIQVLASQHPPLTHNINQ